MAVSNYRDIGYNTKLPNGAEKWHPNMVVVKCALNTVATHTLKYAVAKMGFLEKNGGLYVSTFQIGGIREKPHLKSKMKYYFNLF